MLIVQLPDRLQLDDDWVLRQEIGGIGADNDAVVVHRDTALLPHCEAGFAQPAGQGAA